MYGERRAYGGTPSSCPEWGNRPCGRLHGALETGGRWREPAPRSQFSARQQNVRGQNSTSFSEPDVLHYEIVYDSCGLEADLRVLLEVYQSCAGREARMDEVLHVREHLLLRLHAAQLATRPDIPRHEGPAHVKKYIYIPSKTSSIGERKEVLVGAGAEENLIDRIPGNSEQVVVQLRKSAASRLLRSIH